jgi:UPF0042 nucleotide-binding protein
MIDLLILTGLSGAGKSHASSALEDVGFFVVDNIPPKMILPLVDMMIAGGSVKKLAAIVDVRSLEYFADFDAVLFDLKDRGITPKIMFIESSDEELVKRFESVRRPHPLQSSGGSLLDGITREREFLRDIRSKSDAIIDTTDFSIHDLAREVIGKLDANSRRELKVHIMSFGFKHGLPIDAEFVVDMRFLPNPFWEEELRDLNGTDQAVNDFVMNSPGASLFLDSFVETVKSTFEGFLHENKPNMTIAFGCTGGKHRSVAMASNCAQMLERQGFRVNVTNRDIEK